MLSSTGRVQLVGFRMDMHLVVMKCTKADASLQRERALAHSEPGIHGRVSLTARVLSAILCGLSSAMQAILAC